MGFNIMCLLKAFELLIKLTLKIWYWKFVGDLLKLKIIFDMPLPVIPQVDIKFFILNGMSYLFPIFIQPRILSPQGLCTICCTNNFRFVQEKND